MLCETLTMILVIVWGTNYRLRIDIVSKIGIPMILGSVCIGFIVLLVQSVEGEKRPAARQASWRWISPTKRCRCFAMSIASHYAKVCEIIRDDIHADAVAMTNTDRAGPMLAWVNITIRMAMTSLARLPAGR